MGNSPRKHAPGAARAATVSEPWWAVAMSRAMASPSPEPP
jgi:hypothetical protein